MDKKFGYYIFGGMLIGIFFGLLWSAKAGVLGIVYGALAGAAVGWFAAAYVMERDKQKKEDK